MAEQELYKGVKIRGEMVDIRDQQTVWMWDCGPEEPELPTPPDPPSGKDGDPKYDLAKIGYKRQLRAYEEALEDFERRTAEFKVWKKQQGGPIERQFWSVDARDAMAHDARAVEEGRQTKPRYYVSSRTRGHTHLKNGGLPAGMKPGKGHQANLEREIAGEAEFKKALAADPVFGMEAQQ